MNRQGNSCTTTRRDFLALLAAGMGGMGLPACLGGGDGRRAAAGPAADLVKDIERRILWNGRAGGTTWFHPRACMIPREDSPLAFMTLQSVSGSDYFGPVHFTVSRDLGRTWTDPEPVPGLGRKPARDGLAEGVCDVVPEYHPGTGTVLAMGHNVYYKAGRLARPQLERFPVYVVRAPDGTFSEPRRLHWDDPRGSAIYTCGCAQRVTLENGDLVVPLSFGAKGRTARSVCSVLCAFDGRTLEIKACGNALENPMKRGLLEPNLVRFEGKYYMTIRAEDGHGYVSASRDGLSWEAQRPWRFDDGSPLAMSTTQQHWLPHGEGLFLVYTRKSEENQNVFRWRAPLYMSRVAVDGLHLIRSTERVALPLSGDGIADPDHVARMGNFHTVAASPKESWITVGECLPKDGWRGDLLLARILWNRPNRAANLS